MVSEKLAEAFEHQTRDVARAPGRCCERPNATPDLDFWLVAKQGDDYCFLKTDCKKLSADKNGNLRKQIKALVLNCLRLLLKGGVRSTFRGVDRLFVGRQS